MKILWWVGVICWVAAAGFMIQYWFDEKPMNLPMMICGVTGCIHVVISLCRDEVSA